MYGHDHLGLVGDLSCHVLGVHVDGAGINVSKHQLAADRQGVCHGGNEGNGGNDDLIACLEVCVFVSDLKAGCGVRDKRAGGRAKVLVAGFLCCLYLRGKGKLAGRGCNLAELLYLLPYGGDGVIVRLTLALHEKTNDLH